VTVQELRDTLTKFVELLKAADAKVATTRALTEFVEQARPFDDLKLGDFVKLAEKGRNPPQPSAPAARPRQSGGQSADPGTLAAEVKGLYDSAGDERVTEGAIREACGRLSALKKDGLIVVAEAIGLAGMQSKKKDEIVTQITNRLLERKGAAIRGQLIDRPPNGGATSGAAPALVPTGGE
jgi:hypothetical protein